MSYPGEIVFHLSADPKKRNRQRKAIRRILDAQLEACGIQTQKSKNLEKMTIEDYKQEFINLVNKLQEEHGDVEYIHINVDKKTLGGAVDRRIYSMAVANVEIKF